MSRKLHDRLKPEKSSLSYADFHHEITKCEEDNSLKFYRNQQKEATCGSETAEDELVKYMSHLPRYLERGEKIGDKVLSVGVLDWARLEQWRYGHKHVAHRSSGSSTSTSNTLSSVSTDGLCYNSSRGRCWSPSQQSLSYPSLQSHFKASPMEDHTVAVKPSGACVENYQNLRDGHNNINTQSSHVRADDHLTQNHPTCILKGCNRKYLTPHIDKESDMLPNDQMYGAASCTKLQNRVENLREPNLGTVEQGMLTKSKPVVLLLPSDAPRNSHSGFPDMRTSLGRKFGSPSRMRFSEKPKEPSHKSLNHVSHSCCLPDEPNRSHCQPQGSGSSSMDPETTKVPASTLSSPQPVKIGVSPSRSKKAEERKHIISPSRSKKAEERKHTIAVTSSANGPPQGADQKVTTEKSRSSSPFRRFSISIGFTSKGSGCKDVAHVPHQSSITAPKSSSENARGCGSSGISGNGKPGEAGRSKSSPLRRLLDPLLKPKAAICHHSVESSQKDSGLISKNYGSGNAKFSALLPEEDLDRDQRVGGTTINTVDSSKDKKYVPSKSQALLRITVKNGQPLYTFAVDNNSDILAATVKNLTVTRKDEYHCIYTFFTFREVKKKNGSWMNQASKGKGHDYIHNVVAQMKVSNSHYYDSDSQNCVDSSTSMEFVLFSVKLRQGNAQATDYQPNDELAAIVVKSPKASNFINTANQSSCQNDSQDLGCVTVVLPSGVHSLPSNGGPSSLIERWKTGGSCDCGGWDLACKLRILASESQACRNSRTSKAYFADHFELFLEGNDHDQENRPAFSFSPFKPGIYSVAFDSSLSLLQAFSICIALVDGKMPYEHCGSRNSNLSENPLGQTDELKAFGKLEDIPASYVAYPPVSPVSRV